MRRRVLPREREAQVQVGWFLSTRYTRVLSKHATDTRSRVKCIHVHCACPSVNRVWTPHTHHAVQCNTLFFRGPQPAFAHILNLTHPDRETLKCTLHIPNFLFFFRSLPFSPLPLQISFPPTAADFALFYYWAVSLLGTAPP